MTTAALSKPTSEGSSAVTAEIGIAFSDQLRDFRRGAARAVRIGFSVLMIAETVFDPGTVALHGLGRERRPQPVEQLLSAAQPGNQ